MCCQGVGRISRNLNLLEEGQADIAFAQDGLPAGVKTRNLLFLFRSPLHIAVKKSSKFHSVPDLRGKRVYLGARSSGTREVARLVLDQYAMATAVKYTGVQWNFEEAAQVLSKRRYRRSFFSCCT